MSKLKIERSIVRLEACAGMRPHYVLKISFCGPEAEQLGTKQVYWLMEDDGTEKGRYIRNLKAEEAQKMTDKG